MDGVFAEDLLTRILQLIAIGALGLGAVGYAVITDNRIDGLSTRNDQLNERIDGQARFSFVYKSQFMQILKRSVLSNWLISIKELPSLL